MNDGVMERMVVDSWEKKDEKLLNKTIISYFI